MGLTDGLTDNGDQCIMPPPYRGRGITKSHCRSRVHSSAPIFTCYTFHSRLRVRHGTDGQRDDSNERLMSAKHRGRWPCHRAP